MKDIGVVTQGPMIRLGQFGDAYRNSHGRLVDNDDVVSGIALLQKGADAQPALEGIHKEVKQLNDQILPKGVKIVPFIDRSELLHFTTHTVLHNLTEGMILVAIILFLFLGNVRGALIVALTIPFSLLFAATCLDLKHIPANLLSLGALDFGMVVEGAVVMVENIVRHLARPDDGGRSTFERISEAAHEVQRPVFYSIAIIITAYLPIFTLQSVEGRLFQPMAWTVAFALLGALIFSIILAPVLGQHRFPQRRKGMEEPGDGVPSRPLSSRRHLGHSSSPHRTSASACARFVLAVYSGLQRRHRLRVSAPPGRRRALGARHARAERRARREHPRRQPGQRSACSFPEATECTSQTGRPDDGTDHTGFFNTEYFVGLKPKEQWRPVFHQNKDNLIASMNLELKKNFPA